MTDSGPDDCPFCSMPEDRVLGRNALAFAVADAFPVSPGHTLVIVKRHWADFFGLSADEVAAVYQLLEEATKWLRESLRPGGFNVGVNVGVPAGQTVPHAHVHLIPRYAGDVPDPTGGVRNVIPGKGRYR